MALISPSYILSKVCQEEFNLALALHRDPSYDSKLLSVLVEDTPELPVWCASHRPFDCKDLSKDSLAKLFKAVRVLHGRY